MPTTHNIKQLGLTVCEALVPEPAFPRWIRTRSANRHLLYCQTLCSIHHVMKTLLIS